MGSASLSQAMLHCFCAALILLVWKGSGVFSSEPYKLVCYYASWATYREGDGKFSARDIDPHLCTHIISTSAGINSDGEISILDSELSLETGKDDFRKFFELRRRNPHLELMIGIGGHGNKSKEFPRVVATPESRKTFINSVIKFLNQYRFDGINIDWMFPNYQLHTKNYAALIQELREELPHSMILSIVGDGTLVYSSAYDVKDISKYVDFVNLWSFDYHGPWCSRTGYNAALYGSEIYRIQNVNISVYAWLQSGVDPRKLIVGIPIFGRSYTLQNESRFLPYFLASAGNAGPFTKEPGLLGYNELAEDFNRHSWSFLWDGVAKADFAWRGSQWVSYDSESSVRSKVEFIKEKGLGGAMVYSLDTDNFQGVGRGSKKFHLISTIKEELSQNKRRIRNSVPIVY